MHKKSIGVAMLVLGLASVAACQSAELSQAEQRNQFVEQQVEAQNTVNDTHDQIVGPDCRIMLSLWEAWNERRGPPRKEAKEALNKLKLESNISLVKVIPKIGRESRYNETNIYNLVTGWTETNCGRIFGWEDKVITPYSLP